LRRHLVVPDTQIKPESPTDMLAWCGEYIVEKRPEVIVQLGDFADMSSLSQYDFGKIQFEGRRYKKDIDSAHNAMGILCKPLLDYNERQRQNKHKMYRPEMHLVIGNHECYDDKTEVLTKDGWKLFEEINIGEIVYTFNKERKIGEWQKVKNIIKREYKGKLLEYETSTVSICVTPKHNVFWETSGGNIKESFAKDCSTCSDIYNTAEIEIINEYPLTDEQIQFNAVALTDSYHGKYNSLVFYQSESGKDTIKAIIENSEVEYRESSRERSITHVCGKKLKNKPQKSYEFFMTRPEWCVDNNKRLPEWVFELSKRQFNLFLDVMIFCDGTLPTRMTESRVFYGQKTICEDMQIACVLHGIRATLKEYRKGHWRVNITKKCKTRTKDFLTKELDYDGIVWCASVDNETLLTRRNYKTIFSGNCRINKAIENDPKLDGLMSPDDLKYKDFGWNVHNFLKIVEIDGVSYSHYFTLPLSGNPVGGTITNRLNKIGFSFCAGHQQTYEVGVKSLNNGKVIRGLVCGSFYIEDEIYRGPQGNNEFRGIFLLNEVHDGNYSLIEISLDYLCRRYENMPIWKFVKMKYPIIYKTSSWIKYQEKYYGE
jgi:hypothetical protein